MNVVEEPFPTTDRAHYKGEGGTGNYDPETWGGRGPH